MDRAYGIIRVKLIKNHGKVFGFACNETVKNLLYLK